MYEDPKFKKYLEYISLGGEIAVAFSVPIIAGYWLDVKYSISPWGVFSGVFVGMMLMVGILVRLIKNIDDN